MPACTVQCRLVSLGGRANQKNGGKSKVKLGGEVRLLEVPRVPRGCGGGKSNRIRIWGRSQVDPVELIRRFKRCCKIGKEEEGARGQCIGCSCFPRPRLLAYYEHYPRLDRRARPKE